jgi:hypothetical protein
MGTSARWAGPGGQSGVAAEWSRARGWLSRWTSDRPQSERQLNEIFDDHLEVLRQTLRVDQSAFGLVDAATEAGYRLADTMAELAGGGLGGGSDPGEFLARFTNKVGGDGGTVTDAAIRRAATDAAERLLKVLNTETDGGDGAAGGLAGDLLCLLYQWFFADIVSEFLQSLVAEKVKLVVPILPLVDPGDHIADWAADKVLSLVPSPCESAAELAEDIKFGESVIEDPFGSLPDIARRMVPDTVGKVLGLILEEALEDQGDAGEGAA